MHILRQPGILHMAPEALSLEVLWQACQVVSGSPAMDSGLQGHHRPQATHAQ